MLRWKPPPGVLLILTTLLLSWSARFMVSLWLSRYRPGRILHMLYWVWSLALGNWCSGAPKKNQSESDASQISIVASYELCIHVNLANRFWLYYWLPYFSTATYGQCKRGISIHESSRYHLTVDGAQWLVLLSGPYRGDTVVLCPSKLVWYWLCQCFQATIWCW